jgi:hypothetical protein
MIILTSWVILMAFFVALCMASRRRDEEEREALASINRNAAEPELAGSAPVPENSLPSFGFVLKSS